MCWADRVGILWAFIVLGFLALLWAGPSSSIMDMSAQGWREATLYIIAPVWVFLRLLDFVAGGPSRRRGQFRVNVH